MKPLPTRKPIEYPDSDGKPMADNTLQFQWIVTIKENLSILFKNNPDVFVAGDLFWYPVEGHKEICQAPDSLVAFGRPKGYRGSYKQWEEDGIGPQVVFEILSPNNRPSEMTRKFAFYEHYGVEEYYLYDPDRNDIAGWLRKEGQLQEIATMNGWVSPKLGVRFDCGETLTIRNSDDTPFLTVEELAEERDSERRQRQQAEADRKLSDWEKTKALAERDRERAEKERALSEVAELRARLQAFEKP